MKNAGIAVGMLATTPLLSESARQTSMVAPTHVAQRTPPLAVGVLLPQSAVAHGMRRRVLAGMQIFVRQAHPNMRLAVADIGSSSYALLNGAHYLLAEQQSDVLVAFVHPSLAGSLPSLGEGASLPHIVAGLGANVLRQNEQNTGLVHHSLGYWQSNYAMGRWSAQHLGRRAIIATSLYDSGYDTLYAFKHGFEAAGGGVLDTLVSHKPMDGDGHLAAQLEAIRSAQPDFVYAIYSGREAREFVQSYAASNLAGSIPLAGASLSFEATLLPQTPALSAHTIVPWSHTLPHQENQAFASNYATAMGDMPDLFALLGYETAQLASALSADAHGAQHKAGALRTAHACDNFQRDADGCFVAPLYVSTVQMTPNAVHSRISEPLAMPALDERWLAALHDGERSGWLNAYPFA